MDFGVDFGICNFTTMQYQYLIIIVCIFALFSLTFTCKSMKTSQNNIYSSANGMNITTKTGGTFEIELSSVPSSGFKWMLVEPLDDKIEYVDTRYDDPPKDDPGGFMINNSVKEWMIFKAVKSGQATIQLKYVQPFNPDDPEAEIEEYQVIIE